MKFLVVGLLFACASAQEYRFSWDEEPGRTFTGHEARSHCRSLGQGWDAISLNTVQENDRFKNILASRGDARYFWTSGHRRGNQWFWGDGSPVGRFGWSSSGLNGGPQPDNREAPENCLSMLKGVFNDGIVWHDINCNTHRKPVICEHNGGGGGFRGGNQNGFRGGNQNGFRGGFNQNGFRGGFNQNRFRGGFNNQFRNRFRGNNFRG